MISPLTHFYLNSHHLHEPSWVKLQVVEKNKLVPRWFPWGTHKQGLFRKTKKLFFHFLFFTPHYKGPKKRMGVVGNLDLFVIGKQHKPLTTLGPVQPPFFLLQKHTLNKHLGAREQYPKRYIFSESRDPME